jgi:hypothetical protein
MKSFTGRKKVAWHASSLPFKSNYNDHFETPNQAYVDIKPVIDWLCTLQFEEDKNNVRLFDPYYCNGRTAKLLRALGYENIVHEKRDFYMDISNDTIPSHDIFITNPPFSDSHKIQCLNYCFQKLRQEDSSGNKQKCIPFLLLMPSYVASKQYFRNFLSMEPDSVNDIVYLIPSSTYKYDHPDKTGKEYCPFKSLWFFGIEKDKIGLFQQYWESIDLGATKLTIATSLSQLHNFGVTSLNNRPNPKQRNRLRKRLKKETSDENNKTSTSQISTEIVSTAIPNVAKRSILELESKHSNNKHISNVNIAKKRKRRF